MTLNKISLVVLAGISLSASTSFARYSDACFTKDEARMMLQKRDVVSKAASDCLKTYWATHNEFYEKNNYSKYFGNRNKSLDTADKRAKALLFILWPDVLPPNEASKFEQVFKVTAEVDEEGNAARPGLSDLEKYMKKSNPARYQAYLERKPSLELEKRAQEERGAEKGQVDLRANTNELEQNISCVDMTRRCLQAGFKAAGMGDTFTKVDKQVLAHEVSGTEMQKALSDLGWRTLYFNPDTTQNAAWDAEDQKINPIPKVKPGQKAKVWMGSWGGHADGWSLYCDASGNLRPGHKTGGVMCSDEYTLGGETPIPIDDKRLLVDFRTAVPKAFKSVPFFIGTAHGGYHVFPGYSGNIIEAHSVRALSSQNNLEVSFFNPVDQLNHGGPRWTDVEHYRSGVVVVPPGYLDDGALLQNPPVDEKGCIDLKPRKR